MTKITEKTWVPLGLVTSFLIVAIGCVIRFESIDFRTEANAATIEKVSNEQREYNRNLESIRAELFEIKGKLETILEERN